jgi:hypothetical protein
MFRIFLSVTSDWLSRVGLLTHNVVAYISVNMAKICYIQSSITLNIRPQGSDAKKRRFSDNRISEAIN